MKILTIIKNDQTSEGQKEIKEEIKDNEVSEKKE